MPFVLNATLNLITVDDDVHIKIAFDTQFSEFERNLAVLGLSFHAHVQVLGVDPPGGTTGESLAAFKGGRFAITAGAGPQTVPFERTITRKRAELQEDPGLGDADEIRGQIVIHAEGFPPEFTLPTFTDQKVLLG
jgi:hypothetical protein